MADKMPELIPQPHGGALNSGGTPGNRGGRTPNAFKRKMRQLVSREETEKYLSECLAGKHGPSAFNSALAHATAHGYGKPKESVDVTSGGKALPTAIAVTLVRPGDG